MVSHARLGERDEKKTEKEKARPKTEQSCRTQPLGYTRRSSDEEGDRIQPLGYTGRSSDEEGSRTQPLGYTRREPDREGSRTDHVGPEAVSPARAWYDTRREAGPVQRMGDISELIRAIVGKLPEGAGTAGKKMRTLARALQPDEVMKEIKKILDGDRSLQPETRSEIYNMLFSYYGMEVKQMDPQVSNTNMTQGDGELSHEESVRYDQVFIRDKSNLLDDLNAIYGTETGQDLLARIADNRRMNDSLGTQIYLGYTLSAPYTESLGQIEDEQYHSGEGGYQKGRGAGTVIVMNSRELSEEAAKRNRMKLPKDDSRVMLAHELIHALHAQMGVKPTWEMLVHSQHGPSSSDLDAWLDAEYDEEGYPREREFLDQHPEFAGAKPDDVPTTGIRTDIRYPRELQEIFHINENQIRKELGVSLRERY